MSFQTQLPKEDQEAEFTFAATPAGTGPTPPPPGVTPTESKPTPAPDWRELRRQERAERRAARHSDREGGGYSWAGGIILIVLGGIFLLQNMNLLGTFDNWWALFILIPAIGAFASAWQQYRSAGGQWNSSVTGSLIGGIVLTSIAGAFLLDWNIGQLWPIFLIIGGLSVLLGARRS